MSTTMLRFVCEHAGMILGVAMFTTVAYGLSPAPKVGA